MEQNQEQNFSKPRHVEIADLNEKIKYYLEKAQKEVEWCIKNIEEYKEGIEYDKKTIKRMVEQNEWIDSHQELAKEIEQEKFTEQDFNVVNEDISKSQKIIDMLQEQIEMLKNYQAMSNGHLEGFEQIEKNFKEILLKMNPEDKN